MLQSILVIDETNNYRLWEHIQKIMWFHLRNKIFPSLIPVNSHVKSTNDDAILNSYSGLWKFKSMHDNILKITVSWPGLISH